MTCTRVGGAIVCTRERRQKRQKEKTMSRGVNTCIFIGNLGKDADMRYLQNGTACCNFSIAVTETWKDRDSRDTKERTEWINIVLWGRLAEAINEYLTKGTQVYVEGKFRTEKWQDKEGKDRYTSKIYATTVQLLGGRRQEGQQQQRRQEPQRQEQRREEPAPDFDDDIPF